MHRTESHAHKHTQKNGFYFDGTRYHMPISDDVQDAVEFVIDSLQCSSFFFPHVLALVPFHAIQG